MKIFLEILLLVIIIIILIYFSFYFAPTLLSPSLQQNSLNSVCIKENCFSVELAATEAQRDQGLMYRKELDKDKGMLFIFDKEDIHPFWMKNTLIPLDMIWIDSNNKVVFISQNVQPCKSLICPSIIPAGKAKCVLEINAGISEKIGLKIGDELKLLSNGPII